MRQLSGRKSVPKVGKKSQRLPPPLPYCSILCSVWLMSLGGVFFFEGRQSGMDLGKSIGEGDQGKGREERQQLGCNI